MDKLIQIQKVVEDLFKKKSSHEKVLYMGRLRLDKLGKCIMLLKVGWCKLGFYVVKRMKFS